PAQAALWAPSSGSTPCGAAVNSEGFSCFSPLARFESLRGTASTPLAAHFALAALGAALVIPLVRRRGFSCARRRATCSHTSHPLLHCSHSRLGFRWRPSS